jgi:hypothetical protein
MNLRFKSKNPQPVKVRAELKQVVAFVEKFWMRHLVTVKLTPLIGAAPDAGLSRN